MQSGLHSTWVMAPSKILTGKRDVCAGEPPVLICSVVPMLWTFAPEACVSAVKFNAKRAADDFLLNAHATIVYIYILLSDEVK